MTTTPTFTKAQKKTAKLRLALMGPSGSGKTYSALGIATGLGQKVALIDTEAGSASKYADLFPFDTLELKYFHPEKYIEAIHAAEEAGYEVIVIDSISHEWTGKGGCLELVDEMASAQHTKNKFSGWKDVTPLHNAFIDSIVRSRAHVIATMRSKTEYVLEANDRGKQVPKKVGMAAVQRDGMEFEFDFLGDLDEGRLLITKSRWAEVDRLTVQHPGKAFGEKLLSWLSDGVAVEEANLSDIPMDPPGTRKTGKADPAALVTEAQVRRLWAILGEEGVTEKALRGFMEKRGLTSTKTLTIAQYEEVVAWVQAAAAGPDEPVDMSAHGGATMEAHEEIARRTQARAGGATAGERRDH